MTYEGCVDLAKEFVISGWAVNKADTNERVYVDIIINDELVTTCKASTFREDLKDAGVSDGYSAFNFCPFYWLRRTQNDVRIVYSGTEMALPGGHAVIKSRGGTIDRIEGKELLYKPKISIIMPTHNADTICLHKAVESVLDQSYENWELCIVDDASTKKNKKQLKKYGRKDKRVKVKFLRKNKGVSGASNRAVMMSSGEYLALLDHDDEIIRDALCEVVKAINLYDADVIYSDENIIDALGKSRSLHFKPDFSPDLLFSHNYITHFVTVKRTLFDEVGGFSSEYDGAQDYDLILKLIEKTIKIHHIPKVLYHWRTTSTSMSANPKTKDFAENAGKMALQKALKRRKIDGDVLNTETKFFYRVKRKLLSHPLISIIIPFNDKSDLLERCVKAILHRTSYQNYEIIGLSNNSEKNETFEMMRRLREIDKRIRFHECNIPFNYSKINNYAVTLARGEHIVLVHNDIDIISADWIDALLEHSQRKEVGAVGARLYYADDTIQHAGIIVGIWGFAGYSQKHFRRKDPGYCNRLICTQNTSAVSSALLMVAKEIYEEIGGFDEINLAVYLNDVDFCLRLREEGYLNVFTPYCEAYHYESCDKEAEDTPLKLEMFRNEIEYFQGRWKYLLDKGDPYYNPNLTLDGENFSVKV